MYILMNVGRLRTWKQARIPRKIKMCILKETKSNLNVKLTTKKIQKVAHTACVQSWPTICNVLTKLIIVVMYNYVVCCNRRRNVRNVMLHRVCAYY